MEDEQLLRYSRQIMLSKVDIAGQMRLLDARVLVVGLGGLGAPVAMYLAAAGVGELVLVDDDVVELSNLQRQIIHDTADIGRNKVDSARDRLQALNPEVAVTTVAERLDAALLERLLPGIDVVVDGCDNFATRFTINAACFAAGVPLVSGAAIRFEGQVTVYDPRDNASPCYRCLHKDNGELQESCTQSGVFTPVVGIIGSLQANEAMKLLTGVGQPLTGRLLLIDAETLDIHTIRVPRNPACPVCGGRQEPGPGFNP